MDSQSNDLNEGAHGDNTVTLDATFVNGLMKKIDNLCTDMKRSDTRAVEIATINQNMAEMKQEIINISSLKDDLANLDKAAQQME